MTDFQAAVHRAMHAWIQPRDFAEARAIQYRLARQVRVDDGPTEWRWVLGLDGAFVRDDRVMLAGAVLWDRMQNAVTACWIAHTEVRMPYRPGFLSFRETPGYLAVLQQVDRPVDVLIVDGQGIAHPRGLGIAAHLGVLLDWPTIGVGKTRLFGVHAEPAPEAGHWTPLRHPRTHRTIGAVVRTRRRVRPVFVSPGHRVSVSVAVQIVLATCRGYRLPEPQRHAHRWVTQRRKEWQ